MKTTLLKKVLISIIALALSLTAAISLVAVLGKTKENRSVKAATVSITDLNNGGNSVYLHNSDFSINSANELGIFRDLVNNNYDFLGKSIYLTTDIDLNNKEWIPIGYYTKAGYGYKSCFRGWFYGNYHTIANISINTTNSSSYVDTYATVGFFGYICNAEIANLRLANISINISGEYSGTNTYDEVVSVGCLVGKIADNDEYPEQCIIRNCVISNGSIVNSAWAYNLVAEAKDERFNATGGLVGSVNASLDDNKKAIIKNCSIDCNINCSEAYGKAYDYNGFNCYGVHISAKEDYFGNAVPPPEIPSVMVAGVVGFFSKLERYAYPSKVDIDKCYFRGDLVGSNSSMNCSSCVVDIAAYNSYGGEGENYEHCLYDTIYNANFYTKLDRFNFYYPDQGRSTEKIHQQNNYRFPSTEYDDEFFIDTGYNSKPIRDQLSVVLGNCFNYIINEGFGNHYIQTDDSCLIVNDLEYGKVSKIKNFNKGNSWYVPSGYNCNNGCPLPLGFLVENSSLNDYTNDYYDYTVSNFSPIKSHPLKVEITGKGTVDASIPYWKYTENLDPDDYYSSTENTFLGSVKNTTSQPREYDMNKVCLPYDPFSASQEIKYEFNINGLGRVGPIKPSSRNKIESKVEDSDFLYNQYEAYILDYAFRMWPSGGYSLKSVRITGSLSEGYTLEVEFEKDPNSVKINFQGFIVSKTGEYQFVKYNGEDSRFTNGNDIIPFDGNENSYNYITKSVGNSNQIVFNTDHLEFGTGKQPVYIQDSKECPILGIYSESVPYLSNLANLNDFYKQDSTKGSIIGEDVLKNDGCLFLYSLVELDYFKLAVSNGDVWENDIKLGYFKNSNNIWKPTDLEIEIIDNEHKINFNYATWKYDLIYMSKFSGSLLDSKFVGKSIVVGNSKQEIGNADFYALPMSDLYELASPWYTKNVYNYISITIRFTQKPGSNYIYGYSITDDGSILAGKRVYDPSSGVGTNFPIGNAYFGELYSSYWGLLVGVDDEVNVSEVNPIWKSYGYKLSGPTLLARYTTPVVFGSSMTYKTFSYYTLKNLNDDNKIYFVSSGELATQEINGTKYTFEIIMDDQQGLCTGTFTNDEFHGSASNIRTLSALICLPEKPVLRTNPVKNCATLVSVGSGNKQYMAYYFKGPLSSLGNIPRMESSIVQGGSSENETTCGATVPCILDLDYRDTVKLTVDNYNNKGNNQDGKQYKDNDGDFSSKDYNVEKSSSVSVSNKGLSFSTFQHGFGREYLDVYYYAESPFNKGSYMCSDSQADEIAKYYTVSWKIKIGSSSTWQNFTGGQIDADSEIRCELQLKTFKINFYGLFYNGSYSADSSHVYFGNNSTASNNNTSLSIDVEIGARVDLQETNADYYVLKIGANRYVLVAKDFATAERIKNSYSNYVCIVPKRGYYNFTTANQISNAMLFYKYGSATNYNNLPKFTNSGIDFDEQSFSQNLNIYIGVQAYTSNIAIYYSTDANTNQAYRAYQISHTTGYSTNLTLNSKVLEDVKSGITNSQQRAAYDGFAITTYKQALIAQGFTHLGGTSSSNALSNMSQSQIDNYFANHKNSTIELYKSRNGNVNDYYIYLFTIKDLIDTKYVQCGNKTAKYYKVTAINAETYGDVAALKLNYATDEQSNVPYLTLTYSAYTLRIMVGKLAHADRIANITSQYQYQDESNKNWIYDPSNTTIIEIEFISGQNLQFGADGALNISSIDGKNYTFNVAIPYANANGYEFLNQGNLESFKTYYSGLSWNSIQDASLDNPFFSKNLTADTTLYLTLTLKSFTQTIQAVTVDGENFKLNEGGLVSQTRYQAGSQYKYDFELFVGSNLTFAQMNNYYVLTFTAPEFLKSFATTTQSGEYVIYIIPKISANVQGINDALTNFYVHPNGGYVLSSNGVPVMYSKADIGRTEFKNSESISNISESITYYACFNIVNYELPVYYQLADEQAWNNAGISFNVKTQIDFTNLKQIVKDEQAENIGEIDGWLLTANKQALIDQGFEYVEYFDEAQLVRRKLNDAEINFEKLLSIYASGSVVFYKDKTDISCNIPLTDYEVWKFSLGESVYGIDETFYLINSLQIGSYGALNALASSMDFDPYIRPYLSKIYDITIQNVIKNASGGLTSIHGNDIENLSNYFGVGGNLNNNKTETTTTEFNLGEGPTINLELSNKSDEKYVFFTSHLKSGNETTFYAPQDFDKNYQNTTSFSGSNYWFVYNYGYEIVGWKVMFMFKQQIYYVYKENDNWLCTDSLTNSIDVNVLQGAKLIDYLKLLQQKTSSSNESPKILMVPVWTEATIKPEMYGTSMDSRRFFKYGEMYDLSGANYLKTNAQINGQSLAYFLPTLSGNPVEETIIIDSTISASSLNSKENPAWNYRNIPFGCYTYENEIYTISLVPQFLDNIYKIKMNLDGLKSFKDKLDNKEKYVVASNDYELKQAGANTIDFFDFRSKELYVEEDFEYKSYAEFKNNEEFATSYFWTDVYSTFMFNFKTNYNNSVSGQGGKFFSILRKLFYKDAALTIGTTEAFDGNEEKQFTSFEANLNDFKDKFFIYFASNQLVGELPAFLDENYQLILWYNNGSDTSGNSIKMSYKTYVYNQDLHSQTVEENNFLIFEKWNYTRCYVAGEGYNLTINPYYFRKYYYLRPQTLLDETQNAGEYGYFIIRVEDTLIDDNTSINYLAIFLDGEMQYYSFDSSIQWTDEKLLSYTNKMASSGSVDLINTSKLTKIEKVKFYAGSNIFFITFDQSQDPDAMASGLYDEMIGYKFSSITWKNKTAADVYKYPLNNEETLNYTSFVDAETIDSHNLAVGNEFDVDVVFSKIGYSIDVKLANEQAGTFSIYINGRNYNLNSYQPINNIPVKVEDEILIRYSAKIGYEFAEEAFVLEITTPEKVYTVVLLRNEQLQNEDGTINQTYVLNLTGSWLRQNFYCATDKLGNKVQGLDDFAVNKTDIGDIVINNDLIIFDYKIKIYDSSKTGEDAWLDTITPTQGNKWNIQVRDVSLYEAFSKIRNGSYYGYKGKDGTEYAAISSYSYNSNKTLNKDNLFTNYPFPLADAEFTTRTFNIYQYLSSNLGVEPTIILPNLAEFRTIYSVLEVRPNLTIEVFVKAMENDTNSTEREITISNSATNSKTLTLQANENVVNGYYRSNTTALMIVESYVGLNNEILTQFDTNRYLAAQFSLNNEILTTTNFAIEENSKLEVSFIPNLLSVQIEYYLNNSLTNLESLSQIISAINLQPTSNLNINSKIDGAINISADYQGRIVINEVVVNANFVGSTNFEYIVQDRDYNYGAVKISIYLEDKPNQNITVKMQLRDANFAYSTDDFGTFEILVIDEQTGMQDSYSGNSTINVRENRKVVAKLNLNAGYNYEGHIYFNGVKQLNITSEGLILINNFKVDKDANGNPYYYPNAGTYIIYLSKQSIRLEFENNLNENYYSMFTNAIRTSKSSTQNGRFNYITGAYVGSTIMFSDNVILNNYQLKTFYYYNSLNEKVTFEGNRIVLTSQLIEECCSLANNTIQFGVENWQKFSITLNITSSNPDLINLVQYTTNIADFVSGNYYLQYNEDSEEDEINFVFYPQELTKYIINVEIEGEQVATSNMLGYTEVNFKLIKNIILDVKIEPALFNLNVNEYHFDSLDDLQNPNNALVSSEQQFNSTLSNEYRFNQDVQLDIITKTEDWLLTKIELTTVDNLTLTIEIKQNNIVVSLNGKELKADNGVYTITHNGVIYTYSVVLNDNVLSISYKNVQNSTVDISYDNLKTIAPKD